MYWILYGLIILLKIPIIEPKKIKKKQKINMPPFQKLVHREYKNNQENKEDEKRK